MTYNNSLAADESYRGQSDPTFRYSKVTSRMGQAPERYWYDFNPEDTKQYSRKWVGSGKSNIQTFDSEDDAYNAYQNGDYNVPVFAMMGDNGQLQNKITCLASIVFNKLKKLHKDIQIGLSVKKKNFRKSE